MEVPYWEDPGAHERNSPIHGVNEMTTPLLMAHGSEDHRSRQEANQIDDHRRILEWLSQYLRGEEAPA